MAIFDKNFCSNGLHSTIEKFQYIRLTYEYVTIFMRLMF